MPNYVAHCSTLFKSPFRPFQRSRAPAPTLWELMSGFPDTSTRASRRPVTAGRQKNAKNLEYMMLRPFTYSCKTWRVPFVSPFSLEHLALVNTSFGHHSPAAACGMWMEKNERIAAPSSTTNLHPSPEWPNCTLISSQLLAETSVTAGSRDG